MTMPSEFMRRVQQEHKNYNFHRESHAFAEWQAHYADRPYSILACEHGWSGAACRPLPRHDLSIAMKRRRR